MPIANRAVSAEFISLGMYAKSEKSFGFCSGLFSFINLVHISEI